MKNALITRPGKLLAPQLDYFLVDGSGSMMDKWWPTMAGLDQYLDVLKTQNIHSHGIAHVFDGVNLHNIQLDSEISRWGKFSLSANFTTTPLYDAINLMVRELADLMPPRASLIIVTDGDENGSNHTTLDQAKALLDWCRAQSWQVTFLGADFNNSRQAALLGADESNSIGVRKEKLLEAGKSLGQKRVRYGQTGEDINFSSEEKQAFGGYLTGPAA